MAKMKIHICPLIKDEIEVLDATLCGLDPQHDIDEEEDNETSAAPEWILDVPIKPSEEYMCAKCEAHEDYPLLMLGEI